MAAKIFNQYVVDAFTDEVFKGNPAAVCVLDSWLPDDKMISITKENNLSETAFTVNNGDHYDLRWFTPGGEIDLCGHATLGTAFVLMNYVDPAMTEVGFDTKSGRLTVTRKGDLYEMDFPAYQPKQIPVTDEMADAIGIRPVEAWIDADLVCVLEDEEAVRKAAPDLAKVKPLDGLLLHLTAKGDSGFDCVTRSFAPKLDVAEDPVCGRGHCHVVPIWSGKLNKENINAFQASPRTGVLQCRVAGDRVKLAGNTVLFSKAEIHVPMD